MEMYSIFTVYVHASSVQEILTIYFTSHSRETIQAKLSIFCESAYISLQSRKTKHKVQVIFKSSPRGNKINVKCLV